LGAATAAIWAKLTPTTLPGPAELARAVGSAFSGKHILFHSVHDAEQRLFEAVGVAGSLPPLGRDSIAVVSQNAGGNKLDWFLHRSVRYRARVDPGTGALRATVHTRLENVAPSSGLPAVVIGGVRDGHALGENRMYLSLLTPWNLVGATVDGRPLPVESGLEAGRQAYSSYVSIPAGQAVEVSFELAGRLPESRRYQLDVWSQQTVRPDDVAVEVSFQGGWRIGELEGLTRRHEELAAGRWRANGDITVAVEAEQPGGWLEELFR